MSAKNNSFVYSTLSHPSHRAGPISRRPHQHLRPRDQIPTLVNDLVEARQDHKAPGLIRATSTLLLLPPLELERARLRRDPHPDVERNADDLGEILCRRVLVPVAVVRRRDLPLPKSGGEVLDDVCGGLPAVVC
jgi:hypothetical protein